MNDRERYKVKGVKRPPPPSEWRVSEYSAKYVLSQGWRKPAIK